MTETVEIIYWFVNTSQDLDSCAIKRQQYHLKVL